MSEKCPYFFRYEDSLTKSTHALGPYGHRHDICQQIYATAVFGPKNLRKKSINRDKIKSATKQRKCPKMAILRHLGLEMDN